MKKFVVFPFLLLLFSFSMGQNGGGSGNGNGNSGNWPPTIGESSTACGSTQAIVPGPNGGSGPVTGISWPQNKVVEILREARPSFSNTNLGQMIQTYNQCACVITYLGEGYFRVQIGGGIAVITIDGSF